MSICSAHQHRHDDCHLCQIDISQAIPNYAELLAKAIDSGISKCAICGFEHYNTIDYCPQCSRWREPDVKK